MLCFILSHPPPIYSLSFSLVRNLSRPLVLRTSTSRFRYRLPTRLLQPFADPPSFPSLRISSTSSTTLTRKRSSSPQPSPSTKPSSSPDGPETPTLLPRCVSASARLTSSAPSDLPRLLPSYRDITRRLPRSKRPTSSRLTGRCPASFKWVCLALLFSAILLLTFCPSMPGRFVV